MTFLFPYSEVTNNLSKGHLTIPKWSPAELRGSFRLTEVEFETGLNVLPLGLVFCSLIEVVHCVELMFYSLFVGGSFRLVDCYQVLSLYTSSGIVKQPERVAEQ